MILCLMLIQLGLSFGALSERPLEMRTTIPFTSFDSSSHTFNRPQCSQSPVTATCLLDGETIKMVVPNPLSESYMLTNAEFNVYGVTDDDTMARGFNMFVDFANWRWYVPTFCGACIAPDKDQTSSIPIGNRTSPLNGKLTDIPFHLFLQDPVPDTIVCITKVEVVLVSVLVDPDVVNWGPRVVYVKDNEEGEDVKISFKTRNLGRRGWSCVWSFPNKEEQVFPADISIREPNQLSCTISRDTLKTEDKVSIFLRPHTKWEKEGDYGPFQIILPESPSLLSVFPVNGTTNGGTLVTLTGKNFLNTQTADVKFGLISATSVVFIDNNTISCVSPPWFPSFQDNFESDNHYNGSVTMRNTDPYSSPISVSFDGENYETCQVMFTYQLPSPISPIIPQPPSPTPDPWDWIKRNIWVPVVIVFGVAVLVVLICWATTRREIESEYERLDNGELPVYKSRVIIRGRDVEQHERIGRSNNTYVYRATWHKKKEVALKRLKFADVEGKLLAFTQEVADLVDVYHNHVASIFGIILEENNGVSIVSEYVPRGSLYYLLLHNGDEITDDIKVNMAMETCKGMEHLHNINIVHGDLKTKNILVGRNWEVKVADYGMNNFFEILNSPNLSPAFTDPSVLLGTRKLGKESDVYSFGMVLYEMWVSLDPWKNFDDARIHAEVVKGKRPRISSQTPDEVADLILSCWDEASELRPTFGELVRRLDSVSFVKHIDIARRPIDLGSSPGWMGNISSSVGAADVFFNRRESGEEET
eukprot:TRINITY_DN8009_c0_g1_i1.p1 TRINITY_DN8009_c0_g1~~TRINITY_DN8009_c0_g1_i1.p1  ORF type:complete len:759 (+),score=106.22 TRINITY_DN8009_c0_g1_i1:3-2279(+)